MSNHFFAINRGKSGFAINDFVLGTTSTTAADIELRVADVDGQGHVMTRMDVFKALEAFERMLNSGATITTFPPL